LASIETMFAQGSRVVMVDRDADAGCHSVM
jgi:hypothetical protein